MLLKKTINLTIYDDLTSYKYDYGHLDNIVSTPLTYRLQHTFFKISNFRSPTVIFYHFESLFGKLALSQPIFYYSVNILPSHS